MHPLRAWRKRRPAFLLVEALIGFTLFGMFLLAVGLSLLMSRGGVVMAGDRGRAIALAEHALEAARSIRNEDFALLAAGPHGVVVGPQGKWVFQGTQITGSGYVTSVTLSQLQADQYEAQARTAWNFGASRSGSVVLTTELADWRRVQSTGNWSSIALAQAVYTESENVIFNDVLGSGNYAYITGSKDNGNSGILYVFDVTQSPPSRVWSGTMSKDGYALALRGSVLYVLSGVNNAEVRTYDIGNPASPDFQGLTYNLPGNGLARSMSRRKKSLLIGTVTDDDEKEFAALYVPTTGEITFSGSLELGETVGRMGLKGNLAYAAGSNDLLELRTVDVSDGESLTSSAGSGYNLSDRTLDGTAAAVSGTAAIITTMSGSAIQEVVLLNTGTGAQPPPQAPKYYDSDATVHDVDVEPSGHYAFLAAESEASSAQLKVLDLWRWSAGQFPEVTYYLASGDGRAVFFSQSLNRVFLVTDKQLILLRPN